jgi:hypothetical protein
MPSIWGVKVSKKNDPEDEDATVLPDSGICSLKDTV